MLRLPIEKKTIFLLYYPDEKLKRMRFSFSSLKWIMLRIYLNNSRDNISYPHHTRNEHFIQEIRFNCTIENDNGANGEWRKWTVASDWIGLNWYRCTHDIDRMQSINCVAKLIWINETKIDAVRHWESACSSVCFRWSYLCRMVSEQNLAKITSKHYVHVQFLFD